MARVHLLHDHAEPVNEGERRALVFLKENLADDIVLIPNITVPFAGHNGPEEYDIIAVAPDAVFVVEVKDLAPALRFTEQELIVGDDIRRNPYISSRIKAQKLRTRLNAALPWFKDRGWVSHLVVLAREPQNLYICPEMVDRIEILPKSARLINSGSPLIPPKHHGQLAGRADSIVTAIVGGASPRLTPKVFGMYETSLKLFETPTVVAWLARHRVSKVDVVLEVRPLPAGLSKPQADVWRGDATRMYDKAHDIGPSADIAGPREVFVLDNGAIVLVWPEREANTLDHFLNQMKEPGAGLDAERARKVCAGFAGALHHFHSRGWVMSGEPARHNLAIRQNGRGVLVLGDPLPVVGSEAGRDLQWLGSVMGEINQLVSDPQIAELVQNLCSPDSDHRPSAGLVQARLEGLATVPEKVDTSTAQQAGADSFDRFETQEVLATHRYGTTVRALDRDLKRTVTVKRESGRPESSWALREYRALSFPSVANSPHAVTALGGGETSGESYVETEYLNGPTIATLMDEGDLQEPERAAAVVAQMLSFLAAIHPDIEAIEEIVSESAGVLSSEDQDRIGQIREKGLAHNHITPSNVFMVEGRGVVVADFTRAAKFGEVIPHRSSNFWPTGQSTEVSDPRADLYAVGALLMRMLVTSENGINATAKPQSELQDALLGIALKAINIDPAVRFRTAVQFLDALTSVAPTHNVPAPRPDLLAIQREIETLVSEGRFDEALEKCPQTWTQTIARITEKRELANRSGAVLLELRGLTLEYSGEVEIGPGQTGGNKNHDGGTADAYIVTIPGGGVMEIRVCSATVDGKTERWVGVEQAFGYPDRMSHAVRSHRMSIYDENSHAWMEISQSQLKKNPVRTNEATRKKVSEDGLSGPLGGVSARDLLGRFGVTSFGTREEVLGDVNKRRFYLAARFGADAHHAPAVVHFISRIVPLYVGVEEQ